MIKIEGQKVNGHKAVKLNAQIDLICKPKDVECLKAKNNRRPELIYS